MDQLINLIPWQAVGGGAALIAVVHWGSQITKLLGNHLMHKLDDQTEVLKRIEAAITDNTRVTRALGREVIELRKDLRHEPANTDL